MYFYFTIVVFEFDAVYEPAFICTDRLNFPCNVVDDMFWYFFMLLLVIKPVFPVIARTACFDASAAAAIVAINLCGMLLIGCVLMPISLFSAKIRSQMTDPGSENIWIYMQRTATICTNRTLQLSRLPTTTFSSVSANCSPRIYQVRPWDVTKVNPLP